jgi:hypothetical protein
MPTARNRANSGRSELFAQGGVTYRVPRVHIKVFISTELGWVDIYGCNHHVRMLPATIEACIAQPASATTCSTPCDGKACTKPLLRGG